ncbi:MAG TPA: VOC family protein [Bordetella sp.]|nr:VOC family protein [Bordetella sp.]
MATVKPIPEDMHSVTPHLICDGAAVAIDFYVKAFKAVELARMPGPGGKIMHAMVRIGDSTVMLADTFPDADCGSADPKALQGSPVYLHLYVEDVDATMAQAQAAGATITMPAADMFWGDRYGQLTDPVGHRWSVATHKEDLTPEQMQKNMESAFGCGTGGKA